MPGSQAGISRKREIHSSKMDPEELGEQVYGYPVEVWTPQEGEAVYIPGVSDIIHLTPKVRISEYEMQAHRSALRRGLPSPLSPDQLQLLQQKRERYEKIKASPTPEIVRDIGTVMTWFDDTGDAANTAVWGGKAAIWLAAKIGLKAATRAIPYVGWGLMVKDLVDVVNIWRPMTMRILKPKKEWKKDQRLNPFGKKSKIARARRLARKIPSFGDILEILQTTDVLFGVGISFGPIIGFAEDLFFGLLKGVPIETSWQEAESPIDSILNGMESGAYINSFGQEFTDVEHMASMLPMAAGLDGYTQHITGTLEMALGLDIWDKPMYPRRGRSPSTRYLMDEDGIDPDRREPWFLPGSPETITLTQLCEHIAKQAPNCLKDWLPPLSREKKSFVAGELINKIAYDGIPIFDGSPNIWEEKLTGLDRLIHDILDFSTDYPMDGSLEEQMNWVEKEIDRRKEAKEWP